MPSRSTPPPFEISESRMSAAERGREASELVQAAKAGDQAAFGQLFRRYRPRIYALALHLTGRPADADDITQDAFLRAYRKIGGFEGRSEFFTWLYRIALHRALNVKRNRGRRKIVGLDDARVASAIEVDAQGDPHKAFELSEKYARLLGAFDTLSPSLRTTVVLTTLQGLSYKEAAIVLQASEGTIAWRVHEARRQLRSEMERLEVEPPPEHVVTKAKEVTSTFDPGARLENALKQLAPSWMSNPA